MSMIAAYTKHACRHSLLRPGLRLAQKAAFATSATRKTGDDKRTQHGVVRALQDGSQTPSPTLLESEFSLADRVALVTGANRGLGLEGALALVEAGARAVYCVDVAETPGPDWSRVREYVSRMRGKRGEGRLEYIRGDVADQEQMWKIGKTVGDREGRMDVCLAAAGIVANSQDSLRIPDEHLQKVLSVNVKGVLYTAQAAGQQMERFGNGGSMIFIASVAGHVTVNLGITPYEVAKTSAKAENAGERARAAAIAASADEHNLRERSQPRCEIAAMMARSLGCELAPKGIRVNTISPGYFQSPMLDMLRNEKPDWGHVLTNANPMRRVGEPRELRGAVVWLASDASSFCTGSDVVVSGGHTAW